MAAAASRLSFTETGIQQQLSNISEPGIAWVVLDLQQ